MSRPRDAVLRLLTSPLLEAGLRPATRGAVPILMLHRFEDPERGISGFPGGVLRTQLVELRRRGYHLMSLDGALRRLEGGDPVKRAVVFTVDDGYADFGRIALPIFAEFDCPVTLFVTTGFVDGTTWMWWDRVSYTLQLVGRQAESARRIEELKGLPESAKLAAIEFLAQSCGVDVPPQPPERYSAMTWTELAAATRRGVTLGPHTVTHPVLSRTTDPQATAEINGSWERLRERVEGALDVFCYPNGGPNDQGPREMRLLEACGLRAAVTTRPGLVTRRGARRGGSERFALPRLAHPKGIPDLLQLINGLERLKMWARHETV
jgi:peptidoglycan/xylan/chitin deacetylase (PgdA/CDA1 family)